jgi:hypothetical protein
MQVYTIVLLRMLLLYTSEQRRQTRLQFLEAVHNGDQAQVRHALANYWY